MSKPDPKSKEIAAIAENVLASGHQHPAFGVQRVRAEVSISGGPLPPPEILKKYGEAVPNGAERIMDMAEKEQLHKHKLENLSLVLTIVGQVGGFVIIMSSIGISAYLVMHDKSLEAAVPFFSGIGILLGGGYIVRKQSEPKKQPPHPPLGN